jgi:IclR family pca regulon transcriptional regulator
MLAALAEHHVRDMLSGHPLQARTLRTLNDVDAIMAELELVRKQGYAAVDQEVEQGLRSVAVPLKNARGIVIGALNTGLAASPEPMAQVIETYLPSLLQVSRELQGVLA